MADRTVSVETFEIQSRRARVAQLRRVHAAADLQRRSVGRDVVRYELSKERPARRLIAERRRIIVTIATVAQAAGLSQGEEECVIGLERRSVGEETSVQLRPNGSAGLRAET
jgi:hypothetical protein